MKILKYILYALLALVILFFLVGLLKPTVSYSSEITVDKPVQEAWAVAKDESKLGEWLKGFKSIELIEGNQGEVGSKYKVIVSPGDGQEDFEMIETIASLQEFDHIEMHFDSDFMDMTQRITHTESDGKTTINAVSKVNGKGLMSKSMFALMEMLGGSFTKQDNENFNALKTLINQNKTDYYPVPVEEILEASMEAVRGERKK